MALPKVINPKTDEAAAEPPDDRPSLNAVTAVTENCSDALLLGEGSVEEMDSTGEWIQAENPMEAKQ